MDQLLALLGDWHTTAQDDLPPKTLSERLLARLRAALNIQGAAIYRVTAGGLHVWQTSGSISVPLQTDLRQLPDHHNALRTDAVIIAADGHMIAPLRSQTTTFALLELAKETGALLSGDLVGTLAQTLAVRLDQALLRDRLRRHQQAADLLRQALSLADVSTALNVGLADVGQEGALYLFDVDDAQNLRGLHAFPVHGEPRTISGEDVSPRALATWQTWLGQAADFIYGTSNLSWVAQPPEELPPALHALLLPEAGSSLILPLRFGQKTPGFFVLTGTQTPIAMTPGERRLNQTLADQAALVLAQRQFAAQVAYRLDAMQQQAALARDVQPDAQHQPLQIAQLLDGITRVANSTQDETALIQKAAETLHVLTGVHHVGLVILDRSGDEGTVLGEWPDTGARGLRVSGSGGTWSLLTEARRALVFLDAQNDSRMQADSRRVMQELGIASAVFVPMFDLDGKLMGSAGLDFYERIDHFDAATLEIAESVVSQTSINLQKLRLLRDIQRQTSQLEQIADYSQQVQEALDTERILATTLDAGTQMLQAAYVAINLYDRDAHLLTQVAAQRPDGRQFNSGQVITESENTLVFRAWQQHENQYQPDLKSAKITHPYGAVLHSLLALPVQARGGLLGVLELGSDQPHSFTESDISVAGQLAGQLAISLANAEAYSQSTRRANNKTLTNDITARLQRQFDLDGLMHVTLEELGRALGARRARIRLGADAPTLTGDE